MVSLTFVLATHLAASNTPPIEKGCDIPGNNLRSSKEKSAESCANICGKDDKCKGFTFISGWNKCFLKTRVKTKAKVTMIAAHKNAAFKLHHDHDNSGKDFKNVPLDSAELCIEECRKSSKCQGFSYIKGYRSCWLKKTQGRIFPKVFYCGAKKSS